MHEQNLCAYDTFTRSLESLTLGGQWSTMHVLIEVVGGLSIHSAFSEEFIIIDVWYCCLLNFLTEKFLVLLP